LSFLRRDVDVVLRATWRAVPPGWLGACASHMLRDAPSIRQVGDLLRSICMNAPLPPPRVLWLDLGLYLRLMASPKVPAYSGRVES
jgi:hypothetical protein